MPQNSNSQTTKLSKNIEQLISVFILAFSIILSAFLIHKYIYPSFNQPESIQSVNSVNKQITLPDVNWSEQPKTVILALQTSCHFCNESAPFYKRLIKKIKGKNIKLVAVLPNDIEESRTHLNKLGLTDIDVKQASLEIGTPTLFLVDDKGKIINSWVGKLPPDKETEVISTLISES